MNKELTKLNESLDRYLAVDQMLFKQKLGQELNHDAMAVELYSVLDDIENVSKSLDKNTELSEEDMTTISEYIKNLLRAVRKLSIIVENLARKASREAKYGMSKYRNDVKEYQKQVEEYMACGQALNSVFNKLR